MHSLPLKAFAMICVLASAGCTSTPVVQSVATICPAPPPPPAWTLLPPPDLAKTLSRLISISDAK